MTQQLAAMKAQVVADSAVLPAIVSRPFDGGQQEELASLHREVASLQARVGRF